MINRFVAIQSALQMEYTAAQQSGNNDQLNTVSEKFQQLNKDYVEGLKNFVKLHPKSAVSGWIIYRDLNNPNIPIEHSIEAASYL